MEAIRKRFAMEDGLFKPNERPAQNTRRERPTSVVSVSSSESGSAATAISSSTAVTEQNTRAPTVITISSDEEDEEEANDIPVPARPVQDSSIPSKLKQSVPLPGSANPGLIRPATGAFQSPYHGQPSQERKVTPIAVPSNRDLPRPTPPIVPMNNIYDAEGIDGPKMSTEDTDKALRELMSDVGQHVDTEIDMEDAIVPGFKDNIKLLPHQVLGRKWMADRETGKRNGGILADDMGLGKTIQSITRIVEGKPRREDRESGYAKTTLVICPVAVVNQWAEEIRKMTESINVIEHHGPSRATDPEKLKKAHVIVTSYSIVASEYGAFNPEAKDEGKKKKKAQASQDQDSDDSSDLGRYLQKNKKPAKAPKIKDALFRIKWWRIILDEAHNIKNKTTKNAQACFALEGKYRWCLTGTPMQNSVDELYSLFRFLRLRPLDDWPEFKQKISDPVRKGRPSQAIKRLHVVLSACMLRRTKATILNGKPLLDLPDRNVNNVLCEFDAEERSFYNGVEELVKGRLEKLQMEGGMAKNYTSMLVLLLRLRQACNHPSLVSQDYRKDKEAVESKAAKNDQDIDDGADDLADLIGGLGLTAATKRCQMCQCVLKESNTAGDGENCDRCDAVMDQAKRRKSGGDGSNAHLPPMSSKIRMILKLLRDIEVREEGEKTIIFSQFTSMLDIIEPFLKAEGLRYVRYDGSMTKVDREDALEKIKTSKRTRIILISFKAGSTGLNLTCCNNVILVDLWWNPALEDQAFDRAHRLGQKRNVNIHKLSVPDTVEQRILALQDKKRALAAAALAGDKLKSMKLGMDDLMALFKHDIHDEEDDEDD